MKMDESLLLLFNGHRSGWADVVMVTLSNRYVWIPLYVILALLILKTYGWRRGLLMIAFCGMAVGFSDWFCASVIRPMVCRLRPIDPRNPFSEMVSVVAGVPRSYSFPSCHASNFFCLSTFLTMVFRRKYRFIGYTMFGISIVVCISRLYLGVHYPTDLLCGAIIGTAIGFSFFQAQKSIKLNKTAPLATLLLLFTLPAQAEEESEKIKFEWGGEFAAIFDNREGSSHVTPAQTYFLTRLAPEIGLSFHNREHRVMAGVCYTQPIGCEWDGHRVSPTFYYRYESHKNWSGSMGMFPRTQLIRHLPDYLESDSLRYFKHNILGALLQYQGREGFFEAMIDWRGMQSHTRREAFSIIAQGEWRRRLLYAGGDGMMNHLAKAKGHPEQYVIDNQIYHAYFGIDFMPLFTGDLKFKTLELNVGPIGAVSRDRGIGEWIGSIGGRIEAKIEWWRLGLHNSLTISNKPLFPLFPAYGCLLQEGEPYYSQKLYNRTELSGLILSYKDMIRLHAELDFHITPGDWMFYQRLILTVNI